MPAYVVVNIDVLYPERYAEYVQRAPESVARFGGRYIARAGRTDVLEGDWIPKRFVILEFPTYEDAKAWWASEEYADAKALRHATATTQMVVTEGL
ncbi:MAG TPA: DUF1330 domain-containing protein [Gaiellaceae bacterium]|jgi:uncharacterized protein (DUF1330 family)|nr:DUF1330 domain-containing protein [Gaiellaceae bacterium]